MIHIESEPDPLPLSAELIRQAAMAALARPAAGKARRASAKQEDLTVVLADDARLRQLNHDYLGIDAPTDVLSFPASETDPDTGADYLGDVVVSLERAQVQAQAAGHPVESEVQLLVVHGVLHLLGYDHAAADQKSRMWSVQAAALESIGLSGIKVPDS